MSAKAADTLGAVYWWFMSFTGFVPAVYWSLVLPRSYQQHPLSVEQQQKQHQTPVLPGTDWPLCSSVLANAQGTRVPWMPGLPGGTCVATVIAALPITLHVYSLDHASAAHCRAKCFHLLRVFGWLACLRYFS